MSRRSPFLRFLTDPSQNRKLTPAGWGLQKSSGAVSGLFKPSSAACARTASDPCVGPGLLLGAFGERKYAPASVGPVGAPAHGVWVSMLPRSPSAIVLLEPSITSRTPLLKFRTNMPFPWSGTSAISRPAPKHAA